MNADYSIVYGDKVADFPTRDACLRAFAEACLMIDNKIRPNNDHLMIGAYAVLGEVIIAYEFGTEFEVRMHGVSWEEWEEHGPTPEPNS